MNIIKITGTVPPMEFGGVKPGELFITNDEVYIRHTQYKQATRLSDGEQGSFGNSARVELIPQGQGVHIRPSANHGR